MKLRDFILEHLQKRLETQVTLGRGLGDMCQAGEDRVAADWGADEWFHAAPDGACGDRCWLRFL
ncbi:MAG: hypothetical protein WCT12_17075 [Verrucomicrobiota bacterium]